MEAIREIAVGDVILGGHSYGGRQATLLAAEEHGLADALLLLSYPLHPPRKPEQLRTGHFSQLRTPALFVHGTRDPFGSIEEMRQALRAIPAVHKLVEAEKLGHELSPALAPAILREAECFGNA
jgi:predicted alpha/beta-hydrolase family hydrolase